MSAHDEALGLMSELVIEDGRRWGDAARDFQLDDAREVLNPASKTPYSFLTRGRGGAKTSDLAGIALAVMLSQAPPGARLYAAAADRDQARLLVDSIQGYAARTPELSGALIVDSYRVTANRRSVQLEVLAADAPGAWGLRPYFLVVDEIAQWTTTDSPKRLWEATSSAVAKSDVARLVVLTSAGDPAHWSRKVLDHALTSPLWRVHEVPGPVPWLAPARLEEQRQRLPESSYRRLFLNEWTASEDRLATPADLAACVVLDGPLEPEPGRSYLISLDLGLKNDRTVAIVAHSKDEKRVTDEPQLPLVIVDRLQVWQGTREQPVSLDNVEDWIAQASRSYSRASLVFDPWQAIGLAQRLQGRGVRVIEYPFSSQSVSRLATNLLTLIRTHRLALPNDAELLDELSNVRLRETAPGVLRIDHDPDKHDDRAIALALAAFELVERRRVGGTVRQYCSGCGFFPCQCHASAAEIRARDRLRYGDSTKHLDERSPWDDEPDFVPATRSYSSL